jgi:hypothetical protein
MIDLSINEEGLRRAVARARERGIIIPTFAQMRDPDLIPAGIKEGLKALGLWELHPLNLFRITWKNEPVEHGGLFGASITWRSLKSSAASRPGSSPSWGSGSPPAHTRSGLPSGVWSRGS